MLLEPNMYVLLNEMTKQLLNLNIIQKDGRYHVGAYSFERKSTAEAFRRICYFDEHSLVSCFATASAGQRAAFQSLAGSGIADLFEMRMLAARTENINRSIRSIVWAKFRKSVQKLVVPKNLQTRFLVGEKKSQALENCRSGSGGAELIVVVHFLVFSFLGLVFSASPITLLCQSPALILIMVVYSDWFERFFSVEEI
jgi:hypothetical protein